MKTTTKPIAALEPLLYNRQTTAQLLSISVRSVDYMITTGKLKSRHIGARVLVPAAAVRKMAESGCDFAIRPTRS
jgi:hypothetical protein